MVDDLVRQSAVVLQDIVFRRTGRYRHLLGDRQNVLQVLIRQLVHLGGVVLRDHKAMALRARTDIKESVRLIRFKELHGGNFSINDLAKNAVSIVRHLR